MHRILLAITVSIIFTLGLAMIFNTTSAEVIDHSLNQSTHKAILKQALYALVGALFGFIVWTQGYQKVIRYSPVILLILTFLLILCLVPGVGRKINGARRWVSLLGVSLQPSEFVKLILPAYLIYQLRLRQWEVPSFVAFLKLTIPALIPLALVVVEPNNGTAGVIGLACSVVLVIANVPAKYWALPLLVMGCLSVTVALSMPYVRSRLEVYWNPELDIKGKGHQPHQAKIAAGSGRFLGKGVGNSLQKLSYLPEAQNDYIAAIYAEEFGFVGMITLLSLYMTVTLIGFSVAYRCQTPEGACYASVITFLIAFQAFMNLGVVSGLLPSTGLNLPFFSQGGTSLMANMMGVGILLSISKDCKGWVLE